jgi:PleD family two-component response regulator
VTVSIGVAQYDDDSSVDHLISRSDHWLYKAKESGRNQVQPPLKIS